MYYVATISGVWSILDVRRLLVRSCRSQAEARRECARLNRAFERQCRGQRATS